MDDMGNSFKIRGQYGFITIKNVIKIATAISLFVYMMILAYFLLFGESRLIAREMVIAHRQEYTNFIPFQTIKSYFTYFEYFAFKDWMNNIIGNILIFIPLGGFVSVLYKRARVFWFGLLVGLIFSIAIEWMQYHYNLGVTDVDDIILNVTGYLIGFVIFKIMHRFYQKNRVKKLENEES